MGEVTRQLDEERCRRTPISFQGTLEPKADACPCHTFVVIQSSLKHRLVQDMSLDAARLSIGTS